MIFHMKRTGTGITHKGLMDNNFIYRKINRTIKRRIISGMYQTRSFDLFKNQINRREL
jgi:hypothetical protein